MRPARPPVPGFQPTQRVELDTEAFRRAAERTEVLWPADSDTKSRELPRVVPDFAPGGWFERALN
ncbi:hypothetical protein [Nocardia nepalensis]|uniref:hypothetical protein n=1 Tax=Nocardia nepalensis TaxID=3375448 RepID=UPI003B681B34